MMTVVSLVCVQTVLTAQTGGRQESDQAAAARPVSQRFSFIENRGQWDPATRFLVRGGPMIARFEKNAIVLQLHDASSKDKATGVVVRLTFEGARDDVTLHGVGPQPGVYNFFLGDDRSRWRTQVPGYSEVLWRGLYDGVDLRVREKDGDIEYDLLLSPGADLTQVVMRCEGAERLEVAPDGSLVMDTGLGPIRQTPPTTWYELADGERRPVECRFCRIDEMGYGFEVPGLDPTLALVIDPGLHFSTFLGGSAFDRVGFANGISVNAAGEVLVAGLTYSVNFPVTGGAYDSTQNSVGLADGFVAKLDPTGSTLLWCTFLGGSGDDKVDSIIPDGTGGVFVGGSTWSADYPTTGGAYDTSHNGGADAFVAHLDPSRDGIAQLVYSTLLGATADDHLADLVLQGPGVLVAVGNTNSVSFPTTGDCYDPTHNDGFDVFVLRLAPSLSSVEQLNYSTFIGGMDHELGVNIALDEAGVVTIAGETYSPGFPTTPGAYDESFNGPPRDAFVSRLVLDGNGVADLIASTFLGGSGDENGNGMSVDDDGTVVIAGWTTSFDFPTTVGAYDTSHNGPVDGTDGYVSRLDGSLSTLLASTFFGGAGGAEGANTLSLDGSGIVTVAGFTDSTDYPDTFGSVLAGGGGGDAFVTNLDPDLSGLVSSTPLGGATPNEVINASAPAGPGRVVVGGWTSSSNFPTTPGAFDTSINGAGDAFVTVLSLCPWDCGAGKDGDVGISDLLVLLAQWGGPGTCDFDGGGVGIVDLLKLLTNWGPCP